MYLHILEIGKKILKAENNLYFLWNTLNFSRRLQKNLTRIYVNVFSF